MKKVLDKITADSFLKVVIICILIISFTAGIFDFAFLYRGENSLCIFNRITGYKCPGCGMTRAFLSIGRFKYIEAFHYNIFSIPLFLFMIVYLIKGKSLAREFKKRSIFIYSLLILVIIFGILRNIF